MVDRINQFSAELANPTTSQAERLLAFKFLIHFVGDLHQPLHYPADDARMAAQSGDKRFALRSMRQPFASLMASPAMRWLSTGAFAEALRGCRTCAFVPICGADSVYRAAAEGDPVGDRATSEFCVKHKGLFQALFGHLA